MNPSMIAVSTQGVASFQERKEGNAELASSPVTVVSSQETPPDGGVKSWLTVFGAWCSYFSSFGWVSSVGVFQTYYEQDQLHAYSPSQIAWIPSVQVFIMQFAGLTFGSIFDSFGPRPLLFGGSLLHVLGLMMLSLSRQYYSIFITQSICSGIGSAALYHASTNAVSTWFMKRRAFALGMIGSGSALGGVIIP